MKKLFLTSIAIIYTCIVFAQTPVLYINIVSHNEPGDNLQNGLKFSAMNTKVLQLADIIDAKGAKWNLQTCDGYPTGAFNNQPIASNIFRTLATAPYDDNIEIDPRPKTLDTNVMNIADTYRLLDTLGAKPTKTLGGFVYTTTNQSIAPIDWYKFQTNVQGKKYPWKTWKADMMWGAGSYKPHTNDLNDYGIWKPDTVSYTNTLTSFYKHNPNRSVWYIGNGCQPIYALDSTEDEQIIISAIRSFLNQIENKTVPLNKFYVYSVVINQSHFGPTLFKKISTICDSINSWDKSKIEWKKLTEKISAFQAWQKTTGEQYSQWLCNQTLGIESQIAQDNFTLYPNPTSKYINLTFDDHQTHEIKVYTMMGTLILSTQETSTWNYDFSNLASGMYFIQIDETTSKKLIKL